MKKSVLLIAYLILVNVSLATGQVWDLAADWSTTANPHDINGATWDYQYRTPTHVDPPISFGGYRLNNRAPGGGGTKTDLPPNHAWTPTGAESHLSLCKFTADAGPTDETVFKAGDIGGHSITGAQWFTPTGGTFRIDFSGYNARRVSAPEDRTQVLRLVDPDGIYHTWEIDEDTNKGSENAVVQSATFTMDPGQQVTVEIIPKWGIGDWVGMTMTVTDVIVWNSVWNLDGDWSESCNPNWAWSYHDAVTGNLMVPGPGGSSYTGDWKYGDQSWQHIFDESWGTVMELNEIAGHSPWMVRWTSPSDGLVQLSGTMLQLFDPDIQLSAYLAVNGDIIQNAPAGQDGGGTIVAHPDGNVNNPNPNARDGEATIGPSILPVSAGDTIDLIVDINSGSTGRGMARWEYQYSNDTPFSTTVYSNPSVECAGGLPTQGYGWVDSSTGYVCLNKYASGDGTATNYVPGDVGGHSPIGAIWTTDREGWFHVNYMGYNAKDQATAVGDQIGRQTRLILNVAGVEMDNVQITGGIEDGSANAYTGSVTVFVPAGESIKLTQSGAPGSINDWCGFDMTITEGENPAEWSLTGDMSIVSNPNGQWTYHEGAPGVNNFTGSVSGSLVGVVNSEVPNEGIGWYNPGTNWIMLMKFTVDANPIPPSGSGDDKTNFVAGDIGGHAPTGVTWTATQDGTYRIDYLGYNAREQSTAVGDEIGRVTDLVLRVNGVESDRTTIVGGGGYDGSANAYTNSLVVTLQAGQSVDLVHERSGVSIEDWCGLDMTITDLGENPTVWNLADDFQNNSNPGQWGPEPNNIDLGTWAAVSLEVKQSSIDPLSPDLTGNGIIDLEDFSGLAADWLESEYEQSSDLNRDGSIDKDDLAMLAMDWLKPTSTIAQWPEAGFGNHRALLRVNKPTEDICRPDAVWAHIEWRRRDRNPELKDIRIYDTATGQRITNVVRVDINREYGDLIFQPQTIPGDYEVYYLPYTPPPSGPGGDESGYYAPIDTAELSWITDNGLTAQELQTGQWRNLPQANVLAIQARGEFHRMDPMEVIATQAETDQLLAGYPNSDYLLFPEDRQYPIKMFEELPYRWIENGPSEEFIGHTQPGEYYAFQIGVWAARQDITDLDLQFGNLVSADSNDIPASAFNCINLSGQDWLGRPIDKTFSVGTGKVRPLWIGVQVPTDAAGTYAGTISVLPQGADPTNISIQLSVAGSVLTDSGVSEPWRHSRLQWLDSTLGINDEVVAPFTPLQLNGDIISLLDRQIQFDNNGLPESIQSNSREILAAPVSLTVQTPGGPVNWTSQTTQVINTTSSAIERETDMNAGSLTLTINSLTEFDGALLYRATLQAGPGNDVDITDIELELAIESNVAPYLMGMGKRGGDRPSNWQWQWDVNRPDNMVWLGDFDAGIQLKLCHNIDTWQLFNLRQPGVPQSWDNNGQGGCTIGEQGNQVVVRAYTGPRLLQGGEELELRFRFLITPFKPIDPLHWDLRAGPEWDPANAAHVHHGWGDNPYINYPFLAVEQLQGTVNRVAPKGVNLYYNTRELSNHATEMWALRSLGDEIFLTDNLDIYTDPNATDNPSIGYAWLREHLVAGYEPGWRTVVQVEGGDYDTAILTQGLSRWHNYFVEGLQWLMQNIGIDGLYLDGIGFDREVMKRVARMMRSVEPASRINFHSWDLYASSSAANLYMEHFPYVSNLWFGEIFDYNAAPDYWLVEISGIPFGLTGEMLNYEYGGNPYRGMIYGMTGRLHPSHTAMWSFWDTFDIQDAEMIGYWDPNCPILTDDPQVLATAYVKSDKTLVALASWASGLVNCTLTIDWPSLGLNQATATMTAPAIDNFQASAVFSPQDVVPVEAAKGWLLILED